MALRLEGSLDPPALKSALADVVERHESLRTVFSEADTPHQRILEPGQAEVTLLCVDTTEEALESSLREARGYCFDLSREIPLRATLFRLDEEHHVLLLLIHHIASDGGSLAPLLRDLSTAYTARAKGEAPRWAALRVQYTDYTLWQRELCGQESDPDSVIYGQIAYWKKALAGLPEQIDLPMDRGRPLQSSYMGDRVGVQLPADLHARLLKLARENGATLFMVMQAGLAALLSRLGGGTDIAVGSPIAGRLDQALDELVGFFVNTLVLRTDTSGDPSFQELVGRVREGSLAAYANQDLPFERLVEILNPARALNHQPLFQVMLAFNNTRGAGLELPGLSVRGPAGGYGHDQV